MNEETARNLTALPGHDLYDDVDLAGWDERSVCGYDAGAGRGATPQRTVPDV